MTSANMLKNASGYNNQMSTMQHNVSTIDTNAQTSTHS